LSKAKTVIARFGTVHRMAKAEVEELTAAGLSRQQALRLMAAFRLGTAAYDRAWEKRSAVSMPEDVLALFRSRFAHAVQEEFWVLLLDTKNHLIAERMVTRGLVDRSLVHPREVFRPAIQLSCNRIILTHNHPSGSSTPSTHDLESTRMLVQASKVVGIEIIDHIIIGRITPDELREYVSFRELGLMKYED
jgi:DNA repair protein RadC